MRCVKNEDITFFMVGWLVGLQDT